MPNNNERISYLMLFCMLVLAKKSQVPVEQSLAVVPLVGGARRLANDLASL